MKQKHIKMNYNFYCYTKQQNKYRRHVFFFYNSKYFMKPFMVICAHTVSALVLDLQLNVGHKKTYSPLWANMHFLQVFLQELLDVKSRTSFIHNLVDGLIELRRNSSSSLEKQNLVSSFAGRTNKRNQIRLPLFHQLWFTKLLYIFVQYSTGADIFARGCSDTSFPVRDMELADWA